MSGRKSPLPKYQIVTQGDMSQATVLSAITNIEYIDNVGIQVNITSGSPTGTFDVTISGDHFEVNKVVQTAGTFIALGTIYRATITSGSPATIYFDLSFLSAPYVQLLWTKGSGAGNFDAFIVGKMA